MVETLAERLAKLEQAHREVDDIVLGRWDFTSGKRHLGIAERLDLLTEQVDKQTKQIDMIIKLLRFGLGPLITVCTIASVGSSAREILPTMSKVLVQIIGLH